MTTKSTEQAPSFLQVYTQVRRDQMKHSFLRQINACVDWRGIRTLLNKKYTKTQNAVGNPAYDALLMFKILLRLLRNAPLKASCIFLGVFCVFERLGET